MMMVPENFCVASASTSVVVAKLLFIYTFTAVLVPSSLNASEKSPLASRLPVKVDPATLIVAPDVNAVDGKKFAIVLFSVVAEAAALPIENAPVEDAFSVVAGSVVVFCASEISVSKIST